MDALSDFSRISSSSHRSGSTIGTASGAENSIANHGVCKYFNQGRCRFGSRCRRQHIRSADKDHNQRLLRECPHVSDVKFVGASNASGQDATTTLDQQPEVSAAAELIVTLFSRMKITIGPGITIVHLVTANESSKIIIRNIPSSISVEDVKDICSEFGVVKSIQKYGRPPMLARKVDFETPEQARNAAETLNGEHLFCTVLRCHVCLPGWGGDPAVGMLRSSYVRIEVPAPGRSVYIGCDTEQVAQDLSRELDGTLLQGNAIKASLYEGLPRIGEFTVKVECVPDTLSCEAIRRWTRSTGAIVTGQSFYSSIPDAMSKFHPSLSKCGEVLKWDSLSTARSENGRAYILVEFTTSEAASTAAATLDNTRQKCFGKQKIRVTPVQSVSYILASECFVVIQRDIYFLRHTAHSHKLDLLIFPKDHKGKVRIKLVGDQGIPAWKVVKDPLEQLLAGREVHASSGPVWEPFFKSQSGTDFLKQVSKTTTSYILVDEFKENIIIWGSAEASRQASHQIVDKATKLQFPQQHVVSTLRLDSEDDPCPICLSSITHPVKLECEHKFCRSCLSHYAASSASHRSFPLKCLGNDGACSELLPVFLCRDLLSGKDFLKVVEASFQTYLAKHPQEFWRCPSANCSQVYRIDDKCRTLGLTLQCPACFIHVCNYCNEEEHKGFKCASMVKEVDRLYQEWRNENNVHPCPTCHVDIEKFAGCNHITCSRCATHFCWECMAKFPNTSDVYKHMRELHGGFGL